VWLQFALDVIAAVALAQPAVLGEEPLTLPLASRDDRTLRGRLCEAVRSPSENVVLVLEDVRAEARPEALWEVYVGPTDAAADPAGPYLVGVVSLFDQGIMSGNRQNREPAEFLFVLDRAIAAAGNQDLQVTFIPAAGVVVDGRPKAVDVRSTVTIGKMSLAIDALREQ
jgi:hypothetical protein